MIHERDRQTHRQTPHDGIGRANASYRAAKTDAAVCGVRKQKTQSEDRGVDSRINLLAQKSKHDMCNKTKRAGQQGHDAIMPLIAALETYRYKLFCNTLQKQEVTVI